MYRRGFLGVNGGDDDDGNFDSQTDGEYSQTIAKCFH